MHVQLIIYLKKKKKNLGPSPYWQKIHSTRIHNQTQLHIV